MQSNPKKRCGGGEPSSVVKLTVGWKVFWVSKTTLSRSPVFEAMFRGDLAPGFRIEENDSYFVDEDPDIFKNILHFLRDGNVPKPLGYGVSKVAFERRLVFWGLAEAVTETGDTGASLAHPLTLSPTVEFLKSVPGADGLPVEVCSAVFALVFTAVVSMDKTYHKNLKTRDYYVGKQLQSGGGGEGYTELKKKGLEIVMNFCIVPARDGLEKFGFVRAFYVPEDLLGRLLTKAGRTFIEQCVLLCMDVGGSNVHPRKAIAVFDGSKIAVKYGCKTGGAKGEKLCADNGWPTTPLLGTFQ